MLASHCSVSPKGPTKTARPSQVTRMASFPHHSTWWTERPAPTTLSVSNSAILRWKSVETTHSVPENVRRARDFPLGDGEIWVKGPRDKRWSTHSRLSTVRIVASTERRTSTCREIFRSGGITVHARGGSERPAGQGSILEVGSNTLVAYWDWPMITVAHHSSFWPLVRWEKKLVQQVHYRVYGHQ